MGNSLILLMDLDLESMQIKLLVEGRVEPCTWIAYEMNYKHVDAKRWTKMVKIEHFAKYAKMKKKVCWLIIFLHVSLSDLLN